MLSDECYAEFTWEGSPTTVVHDGTDGVVAVHSLSKRSNMAGVRVGFYAGDATLVEYLAEMRKHAGLMVPGPVQAAAVVALHDDDHVALQRQRYRRRLARLADILRGAGSKCALPAGGFYLWVPVPPWADAQGGTEGRPGAWVLTEALAQAAGMLVSPGEFYGRDRRPGSYGWPRSNPTSGSIWYRRAWPRRTTPSSDMPRRFQVRGDQGATARPDNLGRWPTCRPRSKSCGPAWAS